jgi:hypothetical protein
VRIRLAIPDSLVTAPILDAALEATTRAAELQQLAGEGPTFTELLRLGVRWKPEPFLDGEHFDLPAIIAERGWGDCDDLAPSLAAELRQKGDRSARARVIPSGPDKWHAIVQTGTGQLLDPSAMAGMRAKKPIHGAIAKPMTGIGENALAIAEHGGEWWIRTDLPFQQSHLASTSHHALLDRALDQSIVGALLCGRGVGWMHSDNPKVLGDVYQDLIAAGGRPTDEQLQHGGRVTRWPQGPCVVRF